MATEPKEVALKSVRRHAQLVTERITARDVAIRLARQEGASLRAIADAAGINHQTVQNILDRTEPES